MSLRPSGCGSRSDAVPPHVEKRRRPSRPSSFIMGPVRSSLVGKQGGRDVAVGKVRKLKKSRRVEEWGEVGGTVRSVPRRYRVSEESNKDTHIQTHTHTHTVAQTAVAEAVQYAALLFASFNQQLPSSLTHSLFLSASVYESSSLQVLNNE